MGANSGGLSTQPRHWSTSGELVAGGHLGDHQPRPKRRGQTSERCVGNAGHWREKDPIGDPNATYFQRLRASIGRAGHGLLVFLAGAASHLRIFILRTILVQSSCMPTL